MNRLVAAAAVTVGLCSFGYAAEPAAPKIQLPGADTIIEVQPDCHRESRRHYLDEFGRRVWHHHTRRCNIRLDEDVDDDYDYRRYPPYPGSPGCFIAGSPPLTFQVCP